MLAEDEIGAVEPDILGADDLVRAPFLEHAVLVDARFMGERVAADDRFVARDLDPGDRRHEAAGGDELLGGDPRLAAVVVAARPQRHHDLLE